MDANLFTDNWPDYTTVVSQEFAPRLSVRADIRIHSKIKKVDRVMQVINSANLLPSNVEWQGILCESPLKFHCRWGDSLARQPSAKLKFRRVW